jgi:putative ATPase
VDQQHFPAGLEDVTLYQPAERGFERTLKERLDWLQQRRAEKQERKS